MLYAVSLGRRRSRSTPEPTSLTDAYATIKLATQQQRHGVKLHRQPDQPAGEAMIRGQLQQVVDRYVTPAAGEPGALAELVGEILTDGGCEGRAEAPPADGDDARLMAAQGISAAAEEGES